MTAFEGLFGPVLDIFGSIVRYWWIWLAPVSFSVFVACWVSYKQNRYKRAINWTILELKMPREVLKSPKAMEQFFAALAALRNAPGDFMELYWDGEVTLWFSLEIISLGGDIHFYIRTPSKHKKVLMANLYANYSALEIEEAEDYMNRFPKTLSGLHEKGMDLWGTELRLGKDDAYPIHTYVDYEEVAEERTLDPIAAILEVFSKIHRQENVFVQILIRPAGPKARIKGEAFVKKLKSKDAQTMSSPFGDYERIPIRTPGETEVLEAVERNISKAPFETLIRYIYIADRSVYDVNFAKRGTLSAFNQYAAQDLNYFTHNYAIYTQVKWLNFPYFFPKLRGEERKARMLKNFRIRKMPEETLIGNVMHVNFLHAGLRQRCFILNSEELATLFHPPTTFVLTSPLIPRVESKKMGPTAGLPIFKENSS